MSELRRLAHGVMLAAFAGPEVPEWLPGAYADGLAGICLYGNNLAADGDVTRLARTVSTIDSTAVLALDEEGGDVTRLHLREGSPHPGNAALGAHDDMDATHAVAAGIGAELARVGIWLDLAPSADINSNPANPVIGTRSFGSDPQLVARHTIAYVEGLASQGVAASVKHFPGHGDTSVDSHRALPRVDASAEVLRARELVPFRAAIEHGVATVMTSHVLLTAFDDVEPATLSRAVLTGLLREELGFGGVIISDALDMAGASARYGIGGAAVRSLAAGADLLCLGPEQAATPAALREAVEAVCAAVEGRELPLERLRDAAGRVAALRTAWSAPTPRANADEVIAEAKRRSREVAETLTAGAPRLDGPVTVIRIDTGTNPAVGGAVWGRLDLGGATIELSAADLAGADTVEGPCAVVIRGVPGPALRAWIRAQIATNPDTVLVELGWPDPGYAGHEPVVRTLGSAAVLTDALSRAMRTEP